MKITLISTFSCSFCLATLSLHLRSLASLIESNRMHFSYSSRSTIHRNRAASIRLLLFKYELLPAK
ncbi:unnamed protein product [Albugo candida]|uniref:Secreted protein n=1 Tax=Albugo candida TaxID=65357 RepID=A0A024FVJ8_9STRA|nr:unnamed protein product [Albugo candida]|eukprot:CCI11150.1 unnamed protein product [Albugo candida]